jgi:pyridoxal 5'-phosphate synthase pdxS subunit
MADEENHLNKHNFKIPFVCGCRNLGEALRRIAEGAAMLRSKGEAGTGNIVEAVRHARAVQRDLRRLSSMDADELFVAAKVRSLPTQTHNSKNDMQQCNQTASFLQEMQAPYELVKQCAATGRLPVVNFAAGGVATPADAALMMQLGMDGVFVGSGIFKSGNPEDRARAIVQAVAHFRDAKILAECSTGLGQAMVGITDIANDPVNFRDREAGNLPTNFDGVPKKRRVEGHSETQLYGSSWDR